MPANWRSLLPVTRTNPIIQEFLIKNNRMQDVSIYLLTLLVLVSGCSKPEEPKRLAFCSANRADEWEAFVLSHADKIAGYERSLARATERIRLCAGLKKAKGDELLTAFENY